MDYTDKAKMINDAYDYAYAKAKDVAISQRSAPDGWIAKAFGAIRTILSLRHILRTGRAKFTSDDMYESKKNRQTRELLLRMKTSRLKTRAGDDFLFNDRNVYS